MQIKTVKLGNITNNLDSKRKPLNFEERNIIRGNGKYPYFGANNVIDYIDDHIFDEKILCIAEDGGSWGFKETCSYIVNEKCWVNNHAHVLTAKQDIILDYLMYYLNYSDLNKYITGTTRGKLTRKALADIDIIMPSLGIQKNIVKTLDKAQELIDKRREQIEKLDEFIQSVFLDMFGDPVKNSKKFMINNFGNHISVLTDYHANGSYKILKEHVELLDEEDYALMVRTTDLENNNFYKNVKYITRDAYKFLTKTKVYGGEIIVNKIGSAGNVYLMPNLNRPVSLGMNQFMIRLNSNLNNVYINCLFNSAAGKTLMLNKVRGAVTKSITKDAIREILIPVPPIELQNKFASIVEKTEQQKELLQKSLTEMENNFNSLMQRAFKGELF